MPACIKCKLWGSEFLKEQVFRFMIVRFGFRFSGCFSGRSLGLLVPIGSSLRCPEHLEGTEFLGALEALNGTIRSKTALEKLAHCSDMGIGNATRHATLLESLLWTVAMQVPTRSVACFSQTCAGATAHLPGVRWSTPRPSCACMLARPRHRPSRAPNRNPSKIL